MQDARQWLPLFLEFIERLTIDSKELSGPQPLMDHLYRAQYRYLEQICEGLDRGVRHFTCLKARQLGISTISLAIDLFWLFVHPGLQGALVTDTEGNRDKFRIIIDRYMASLPRAYKVGIKKHNRNNLVLSNGSVLDYIVAGTKKGGGLGRSRAFNFVHATECSSYGDAEGVASLMASIAETHPDRLYMFESTARGFNLFWNMWEQSRGDEETQKAFFIGWWAKDIYRIDRTDALFAKYFPDDFTDAERDKIEAVKNQYGWDVTQEQVAWYRWKEQTRLAGEGQMDQEYPWTEEEAFVLTGTSFFPQKRVGAEIKRVWEHVVFKGYQYHLGDNFMATDIEQSFRAADSELKIWEEPDPNGVYVIGCDPAYGRNEWKDSSAIQVLRCYADKTIQVAEYASPNPQTFQATWVLAHLAGCYRNCILNIEVTGPGWAIMQELKHLKQQMQAGLMVKHDAGQGGLLDMYNNVRWYLYHRPDSMGAGYAYGWSTTVANKLTVMNQLRDEFHLEKIEVNSMACLEEMRQVVQDGQNVEASGRSKDDRVFALALANKAYIEWVRGGLILNGQTYQKVGEADRLAKESPTLNFTKAIVESFFDKQARQREDREYDRAEYD